MRKSLICILFGLVASSYLTAQRSISDEAKIFQKYRDGVFTIQGDMGSGSGFLIHKFGLVVTNVHVIAGSVKLRVQINDTMKVPGLPIFIDKVLDIAILQVAPEAVAHLKPLVLFDEAEPIAYEGERVLAIGSPLSQIRIVTAGIVSKVKRDVIISDVNINHGNSGGPMLNLDGQVIAVNTFLDTDGTGAGVAGSVVITQASKMIEDAIAMCEHPDHEPPPFILYPVMPSEVYPVEELVWSAVSEERDPDFY